MQALMEKISVRELRLLMLGVGATVVALLVTTLVVPNVKSMQAVRKEIQLLEATARDGRELEQQLEQQHASIAELRYQLDGNLGQRAARSGDAIRRARRSPRSCRQPRPAVRRPSPSPTTGESATDGSRPGSP